MAMGCRAASEITNSQCWRSIVGRPLGRLERWPQFRHPRPEASDGFYHFADILISRSTSGGASWSAPTLVSPPQTPHLVGRNVVGTDHYQPGIAVDKAGAIGVCWYDRRSDLANLKFGRACSISMDPDSGGPENFFVNGNWSPWHATDVFINPAYLGDYDALASDTQSISAGFLGAYGFVNTSALVPTKMWRCSPSRNRTQSSVGRLQASGGLLTIARVADTGCLLIYAPSSAQNRARDYGVVSIAGKTS